MDQERKDLKKNIKKAMNTPNQSTQPVDENKPIEAELKEKKVPLARSVKWFGILCIAATIVSFALTGTSSVDTSQSARNALQNGISTGVSAGVVLLANDENMSPKDYTISHHSSESDTQIWVWDYAAEDGDFVQVLVNGAPISDPFMIKHKPRTFTVPATGVVQVKGIKDGGGGITYAVRYAVNGTSYFNGTPEGEFNTYTLTIE